MRSYLIHFIFIFSYITACSGMSKVLNIATITSEIQPKAAEPSIKTIIDNIQIADPQNLSRIKGALYFTLHIPNEIECRIHYQNESFVHGDWNYCYISTRHGLIRKVTCADHNYFKNHHHSHAGIITFYSQAHVALASFYIAQNHLSETIKLDWVTGVLDPQAAPKAFRAIMTGTQLAFYDDLGNLIEEFGYRLYSYKNESPDFFSKEHLEFFGKYLDLSGLKEVIDTFSNRGLLWNDSPIEKKVIGINEKGEMHFDIKSNPSLGAILLGYPGRKPYFDNIKEL